jgi:hypothetical protein
MLLQPGLMTTQKHKYQASLAEVVHYKTTKLLGQKTLTIGTREDSTRITEVWESMILHYSHTATKELGIEPF